MATWALEGGIAGQYVLISWVSSCLSCGRGTAARGCLIAPSATMCPIATINSRWLHHLKHAMSCPGAHCEGAVDRQDHGHEEAQEGRNVAERAGGLAGAFSSCNSQHDVASSLSAYYPFVGCRQFWDIVQVETDRRCPTHGLCMHIASQGAAPCNRIVSITTNLALILLMHLSLLQVEHVKAERNVLAEVHNPYIVKLYYSFQDEDFLYLVMEYLSGGDVMVRALTTCVST